jgi:hypothetical protein
MNSGLIGKIEKARRYAQEPERITISALTATFGGDNDSYELSLAGETWRCSCHTHETFGDCQHLMALQTLLKPMIHEHTSAAAAQGSPTSDGARARVV